jgi:hypothetical protein
LVGGSLDRFTRIGGTAGGQRCRYLEQRGDGGPQPISFREPTGRGPQPARRLSLFGPRIRPSWTSRRRRSPRSRP